MFFKFTTVSKLGEFALSVLISYGAIHKGRPQNSTGFWPLPSLSAYFGLLQLRPNLADPPLPFGLGVHYGWPLFGLVPNFAFRRSPHLASRFPLLNAWIRPDCFIVKYCFYIRYFTVPLNLIRFEVHWHSRINLWSSHLYFPNVLESWSS